jgi:hypothetical protein
MLTSFRLALVPLCLAALAASAQILPAPDTLPAGVPLRIRITRTAHLHRGAPVVGVLTEPVFLRNRLVLPQNSIVRGVVIAYAPVARKLRTQALLNGDVTPLHDPIVTFNTVELAGSSRVIAISSRGVMRDTQLVRFLAHKSRPNYIQQAENIARAQIKSVHDTFFTPGRTDRALRLLYSQLPYHPQRIWAGTGFVAELSAPLSLPGTTPRSSPVPLASAPLDSITVSARLDQPLDSATSRPGDRITATVTQPVFNNQHDLLVPEGAQLVGVVTRAKPARRLGRNGELRFGFRGLSDDTGSVHVDGNLTAAAGSASENLTVDGEGNVHANPDKGKVLAPLLLAYTAALGHDDDGGVGQTVVGSNGFGLVARLIAFSNNKNVGTGFGMYALAKSIYFRYLDRGHQVDFPRNTEVEVQLVARSSSEPAATTTAAPAPALIP